MQQLLDLYEVQKIDLGIRDLDKRLADIPAKARQVEAELTAQRALLQRVSDERDFVQKEATALRANQQSETAKVKKWEQRLNEIRNQREYLALSREVDGANRQNREADEKLAELGTKRSELDKQFDAAKAKVSELEQALAAEKQAVEEQSAALRTEITNLTARRQELSTKVPRPLFAKYEQVRAKRMGVGIVPVVGGCCQGCNMRLPPQLYNMLQRGNSVEQCPSCNRIVFWDAILPKTDGAAAAPAAASS